MIELELDRLLKRAKNYLDSIKPDIEPQIATLLHRYLCILLSANIDRAIQLILTEFARTHGSAEIKRYVEKRYERGTNYNAERVIQTLARFDPSWAHKFEGSMNAANLKELLDSLCGLRNSISHGVEANVSRPSLDGYFDAHKEIIGLVKSVVLGT
jgi:HEPN superfamily RiboL-PSP-like protein